MSAPGQGVYREGGAAGGLPLPRTHFGLAMGVIGASALLALAVPPVLVTLASSGTYFTRLVKGGAPMFVVAILQCVLPFVLAGLGVRALRRPALFGGVMLLLPLAPAALALFSALRGMKLIGDVLEAASPSVWPPILLAGISETLACDEVGGLATAGCACVVAVSATSVAWTIDARAATRAGARQSATFFPIIVAAVWPLASVVTLAVYRVGAPATVLVVGCFPLFALAVRRATLLADWHDRAEAMQIARALVTGVFALALAAFAAERAMSSMRLATALELVGGADGLGRWPEADVSVVARAQAAQAAAWRAHVANAVGALAAAAAVSLAISSRPAKPAGAGNARAPVLAAALGALVIALSTLGASVLDRARARACERLPKVGLRLGLTLPQVDDGGFDVVGGAEGAYDEIVVRPFAPARLPPGTCDRGRDILVHAEATAKLEDVRKSLTLPESCPVRITFAGDRMRIGEAREAYGPFAFLVSDVPLVGAEVDAFPPRPVEQNLDVTQLSEATFLIGGKTVRYPTPAVGSIAPDDATPIKVIRYAFLPDETVGRAVEIMSRLERQLQFRLAAERSRVIRLGAPLGAIP